MYQPDTSTPSSAFPWRKSTQSASAASSSMAEASATKGTAKVSCLYCVPSALASTTPSGTRPPAFIALTTSAWV